MRSRSSSSPTEACGPTVEAMLTSEMLWSGVPAAPASDGAVDAGSGVVNGLGRPAVAVALALPFSVAL